MPTPRLYTGAVGPSNTKCERPDPVREGALKHQAGEVKEPACL